jgi:ornithine--oxo-acid transaminase
MLAVELHPEAGGARPVCERLKGLGFLCKDTHDHTVRISPPLVLTADQADSIAEAFETALRA